MLLGDVLHPVYQVVLLEVVRLVPAKLDVRISVNQDVRIPVSFLVKSVVRIVVEKIVKVVHVKLWLKHVNLVAKLNHLSQRKVL